MPIIKLHFFIQINAPREKDGGTELFVDMDSEEEQAEQCGWCKDKYGVSWQISLTAMSDMMENGNPEQIDRITQAFLLMKKLDLAKIKEVYET